MLQAESTQATTSPAEILNAVAEAPATPDPALAKPGEDKLSPKLQVLIQRERAAVARERAAKQKELEIATRLKNAEDREARLTEFESIKKTNPMKALELLGLSYQDLTQIALNDGNVNPDIKLRQIEEKISHIEKQKDLEAQKQAEAQAAAEQAKLDNTVKTFKNEIGSYLKENNTRYELIFFEYSNPEEANELIYGVIEEHFERTKKAALAKCEEEGTDSTDVTGEVMTIAQAADKVEQHLEQKYDKARTLSKVKVLLAPKPEQLSVKQITPSQKPKTLTNQLSATPERPKSRVMTDDERIQKAIAYAKGLRA